MCLCSVKEVVYDGITFLDGVRIILCDILYIYTLYIYFLL